MVYAYHHESKRTPSGEAIVTFACRDAAGNTGHIEWSPAWEKRDMTADALATDQPAWAVAADENTEWPSSHHNPTDFVVDGETGAAPPCPIAAGPAMATRSAAGGLNNTPGPGDTGGGRGIPPRREAPTMEAREQLAPRQVSATGRSGRTQTVTTSLSPQQAALILQQLPEDDFAQSLLASWHKYGLNMFPAMRNWLLIVAQKHLDRQAEQAQPREQVGDFGQIRDLFVRARGRLQHPKIRLQTPAGLPVWLSLAGPRSQYAGSITVNNGERYGDPAAVFYGRVLPDGSFDSRRPDPGVLQLLREFGADPAGVAARYGHLTGSCCFCGLGLTDERSVSVGYGPVCARTYSLPWGNGEPREERPGLSAMDPDLDEELEAEQARRDREDSELAAAAKARRDAAQRPRELTWEALLAGAGRYANTY